MKQVTKNKIVRKKIVTKKQRKHPLFGTSKLEEDFARDFLDKLKVKYVYQFEAKDIKRWYDFYLPEQNLIIEIDGSYFHSDPRLVKEDEMNPMQKRNKRVDKIKDEWALSRGIPIMRIWEKDIREAPEMVMKELMERLYIEDKRMVLKENKRKRHINKIAKK